MEKVNAISNLLPDDSRRHVQLEQRLNGDEPTTLIDPRAPLKFGDPSTAEQWLIEMSKGNYGGPEFKNNAELLEAVSSVPVTHVALLRFLVKVAAGRLHVADQSERKHKWLVWNGRIYDTYNQKFTNTITTCLADVLEILYEDYLKRTESLRSDKEFAKTAVTLLKPIESLVSDLRKSSGLFGFAKVMLGDATLSYDEDDHEADDLGYVVEADGRLRHVDNLDVIADPDPSLFITRTLNVCTTDTWEDNGEWSQFLLETFGDADGAGGFIRDEEKEALLRQAAGVALIGTGQAKAFIHILGTSNSGKSFYLDALARVFGDFGHPLSSSAIVKLNGVNFQQDEARGVRFLFLSEPDTSALDGPFVKTLTGGSNERITTSRKGLSGITWSPRCLFHVVSNEPLKFNASEKALNKRILTITADNSVEESDPRFDPHRVDKIIASDIETIYRWALQGAKEFIANGGRLDIPEEVRIMQKEREDTSNSAIKWLNDKIDEKAIDKDPSLTAASNMYKWNKSDYLDYDHWCTVQGLRPYSDEKVRSLINTYMGAPSGKNMDVKKEGYYRLWGLAPGEGASAVRSL